MKLKIHQTSDNPLHLQIAEQIREQIKTGSLKPGDRLPSYNEIRAAYGIHTNTMEKVLARLDNEGLIERRRGSGTYIAAAANPIVAANPNTARSSFTLGLVGDYLSLTNNSSYWANLMGGMQEAVEEAGAGLLLLGYSSFAGWEKADGVLLCDLHDETIPFKPNTHIPQHVKIPPSLPCVSLLLPHGQHPSIVADDASSGASATNHLLALGHRRIAFLHGYEHRIMRQRLSGYEAALRKKRILPSDSWRRFLSGQFYFGGDFVEAGYQAMKKWLADDWNSLGCTAIIAHNDETAIGIIKALQQSGYRVPEDVSVVGFDGTEIGSYFSPALTSVALPLREIGATAVRVLLRQLAGENIAPEPIALPVEILQRNSTAPPKGA